jgi:hypothetical protein
MWPSEATKIQQNSLGVLNLCERDRQFARHIHVTGRDAGERGHPLPRNNPRGSRDELLTYPQRPHENVHLHGFNPEDRCHLRGLSVGCVG